MVRYSRLPFRQLVREFGAELVYTPMLISDSFIQSKSARDADFRSNSTDGPLIVQFASNKPETFGEVAQVRGCSLARKIFVTIKFHRIHFVDEF